MAAAAAKLENPATDMQTRVAIITEIRKQLSKETKPPIEEVINAGITTLAVKYLGSDDAALQFEASWVLLNIASGTDHQTQAVVDAGGIPALLEMRRTAHVETQEIVVWAIANIAGGGSHLRDLCLQAGTMDAFLECLDEYESRIEMVKLATWGIANIFREWPRPQMQHAAKALPCIFRLLQSQEAEVLTDAFWALSYI